MKTSLQRKQAKKEMTKKFHLKQGYRRRLSARHGRVETVSRPVLDAFQMPAPQQRRQSSDYLASPRDRPHVVSKIVVLICQTTLGAEGYCSHQSLWLMLTFCSAQAPGLDDVFVYNVKVQN